MHRTASSDYNPAYKYHLIYLCNQANTVSLLKSGPVDLTGDETTWAFGGFGESGASLVLTIKGKKCGRGGQTVLVMEAGGRKRLICFVHRHKKHEPKLSTSNGAHEALLINQMLRKMSQLHNASVLRLRLPMRLRCHGKRNVFARHSMNTTWTMAGRK